MMPASRLGPYTRSALLLSIYITRFERPINTFFNPLLSKILMGAPLHFLFSLMILGGLSRPGGEVLRWAKRRWFFHDLELYFRRWSKDI
jgi:hypothetical protein